MNTKYLSIITNFGCHYTCPYCVVKENGLQIPVTTIDGLNDLDITLNLLPYTAVSVSGGGDPLHNYELHKDWYRKLLQILDKHNMPFEMHTSYIDTDFPMGECDRVVYHIRDISDISKIKRKGSEKVRVVMVAVEELTAMEYVMIALECEKSIEIDELSFRQMINNKYETMHYNHDFLMYGHRKGWWYYIRQCDFNDYYVENKIYHEYSKIGLTS